MRYWDGFDPLPPDFVPSSEPYAKIAFQCYPQFNEPEAATLARVRSRIAQVNGQPGSTPEILMRGPTSINASGRTPSGPGGIAGASHKCM